jgi:hypothetical protein
VMLRPVVLRPAVLRPAATGIEAGIAAAVRA